MRNPWRALQRNESPRERRLAAQRAHERFVAGESGTGPDGEHAVRDVVLDSWQRSLGATLSPDRAPGQALSADALSRARQGHPLATVLPVVRRLLVEEASESGFIVAVGDAGGRLLWIDGDHRLRSQAEDMGFAPGVDWSEAAVGTSAPGTALALGRGLQVLGAEHFNRGVHEWGCTAVPVRDPETDTLLGVIDLTGGDEAVAGHTLSLVEATVAAVEAELRMNALRSQIERGRSTTITLGQPRAEKPGAKTQRPVIPSIRLSVLGREPALLEGAGGVLELGNRHAEILTALVAEPAGLSAAQLAERVYGRSNAVATLRPEMVRLRRVLEQSGQDTQLCSKPYRLSVIPVLDAAETLAALARGAHRLALAGYAGRVLPGSTAPMIERLRAEVDATLREAMLADAAPDLLFEYAQAWADQDAEVWETLLAVLPARSPKRARVLAKLRSLPEQDATSVQP